MALEAVAGKPGLWVDGSLHDAPAAHAVVIGVSDYPHLDGGSGPRAAQTYGLGQLPVSALTAYRFFDWLRTTYRHDVAPVGSMQLLLAPTANELSAEPSMDDSYERADFDACEAGLNAWRQRLRDLPATIAAQSRAVFFFSGHGLEISQQKQILLPSDYLRPDRPSLNRAISTLNLKHGLLSLPVCDQLFFVDACRNGSQLLGGTEVEGTALFDVTAPHLNNPDANSAVMYGTASGSASWQPSTVQEGPSLFGTALIEAVTGGADIDLEETPPTVWFSEVASYTNQAIRRQLQARGAHVRQAIRGDLTFVGVIHADPPTTVRGGGGTSHVGEPGAADLVSAGVDVGAERGIVVRERSHDPDALHIPRDDGEWTSFSGSDDPHKWFGREQLTEVWTDTLRAVDLRTGTPVQLDVLGGQRFQISQQRLRFATGRADPTWVTIDARNATYAMVLPGGDDVEFELGLEWSNTDLLHVEVDISPDSPAPLGRTAQLWMQARETDAASVSQHVGRAGIEQAVAAVRAKVATPLSPLGAITGSLILLRAGHAAGRGAEPVPEPWARNMATLPQFHALPDGVAIWAEVLSRMGRDAPQPAGDALELLATRDHCPLTHDGFGYALAVAEIAAATATRGSREATRCADVHAWLAQIGRFTHLGGLFLVLTAPRGVLDRTLVMVPPSLKPIDKPTADGHGDET